MNWKFYILILISAFSFAQKKIGQEFGVAKAVKTIYLDFNQVFTIQLKTHSLETIKIEASSEGEYANSFVLTKEIKNGSLVLAGNVSFGLVYPQDKLSAHKVHAVEVMVYLPKNKQVVLTSDIGNVTAVGEYESLFLDLQSGDIHLKSIAANVTAQSVTGAIQLQINTGVVNAFSKYGKVVSDTIPEGLHYYVLKSLKGNINIQAIR